MSATLKISPRDTARYHTTLRTYADTCRKSASDRKCPDRYVVDKHGDRTEPYSSARTTVDSCEKSTQLFTLLRTDSISAYRSLRNRTVSRAVWTQWRLFRPMRAMPPPHWAANFRGSQIITLLNFSTLHNASFSKRFSAWTTFTKTSIFSFEFVNNRATGTNW